MRSYVKQAKRITVAMEALGYDAPQPGDHPETVWAEKIAACLEDLVKYAPLIMIAQSFKELSDETRISKGS